MIVVRRTSVSKLAMMLQDKGAIRYQRGSITVVDAQRLKASSCECHQSVRNNYETLFGRPWPRVKPEATGVDAQPSGGKSTGSSDATQ